jgi:hypothetical protein
LSENKPAGRTVTVKLDKPIVGHGGVITKAVLREPTYAEYMEIGDPFLVGVSPGSRIPFIIEDPAVISKYCEVLLVEPDALLIQDGGMELAKAIRREVRSFFRDGDEAGEASKTSPTSSPSAPGKTAAP